VGKFNALHKGHKRLIEEAKKRCDRTVLISIRGKGIELFSEREREEIAKELGVELLNLSFEEVKEISPQEFMKFLKDLGCSTLIVGKEWRFGKNRSAGVKEAKEIGEKLGVEVVSVEPIKEGGKKVGTSEIYSLLKEGRIREANRLLGYPFFVVGKVVKGRKVGRKIGFPTLNVDTGRELPLKFGVYAARLVLDGKGHSAVANYGVRPTFDGSYPVLEVHVPDEKLPPLYGREVKVEFLDFIRPEKRFSDARELKRQIELDVESLKRLHP
jgi:riboflavin kinase/FMN adenylyltransferase